MRRVARTLALSYGKAVVIAVLAAKQAEDGFPPNPRKTFDEAVGFAQDMRVDTLRLQKNIWRPHHRSRGDALEQIMTRQLHAGYGDDPRRTAHLWRDAERPASDL